jgi:D-amino-acid dehydrogenase
MQNQQQVAVIGGGVIGVCSAYFLAQAGHQVVVIERRGNVAEESSHGNAGLSGPASIGPWAAPGMPKQLLSMLFKATGPAILRPTLDPVLWRWLKQWRSECELERFRINHARMQRIATYSSALLCQLAHQHELDFEQTRGYLQLFRDEQSLKLAAPALALLAEQGVTHRMLDADAACQVEPALVRSTQIGRIAGALQLPHDASGNCALFTKQLKLITQAMGVQFRFGSAVTAIEPARSGVALRLQEDGFEKNFSADAVVLAAGVDSAALLQALGIRIPLYPVKSYCATVPIKNLDAAPLAAIMDESYKVTLTRMGHRIRLAGTIELGSKASVLHGSAQRTLRMVGADWFPDAANFNRANFWSGMLPMLPDGAPLLSATPINNLYINLGHGSTGWAMALGSGKVLADMVSGRPAEIDLEGLDLSRYAGLRT